MALLRICRPLRRGGLQCASTDLRRHELSIGGHFLAADAPDGSSRKAERRSARTNARQRETSVSQTTGGGPGGRALAPPPVRRWRSGHRGPRWPPAPPTPAGGPARRSASPCSNCTARVAADSRGAVVASSARWSRTRVPLILSGVTTRAGSITPAVTRPLCGGGPAAGAASARSKRVLARRSSDAASTPLAINPSPALPRCTSGARPAGGPGTAHSNRVRDRRDGQRGWASTEHGAEQ